MPDMPTYRGIMQEQDAYRAQQNALAQQQMKQQQNAMLNQAYRAAYDPQTGRVDQAKLYGSLAEGGMGAEIPGQMEALGKGRKESGEGAMKQLEYGMAVVDAMHSALANSRDRASAQANGARLAQAYPELAEQLSQELASVPSDPAQFAQWREGQLRSTLEAKDQLKQHFQTQNLGGSTRVLAMPEYGGGGAAAVPGSEAEVTMSPAQANPTGRVVQGEDGSYYLVNTRTAGAAPVTVGGGGIPTGRGGASALATNPGALKDGAFARSQPGYAGASGAFATFETPEAGVRAQENLLRSAYVGKGFNTISKIVDRYAPQGPENSPASVSNYKQYIAQQTGIDVNSPISAGQVPAVAQAMREFETGQRPGGRAPAAGAAPGQLQGPAKGNAPGKAAQASAEAYNAMEAASAKYDDTIARAKRLLNNPALDTIVGNVQGNIPETALSLYSQSAANALSDYNELLAVAGFQELQAMRDASPTGGALGQVSDSENRLLQQSAFAASRTQDENKFRQSLQNYIKRLEESRRRVEGAYERTFGSRFAPSRGGAAAAPSGGAPKRLKYNPATGGFD
jgi:hypothetical protein